MRISKQEWDAFWKTLGNNWYIDDSDEPEIVDDLKPSDTFEITGGFIGWQGNRELPGVPGLIKEGEESADFLSTFRKWRKQQDQVFIVVQIHENLVDELVKKVKSVGGKIIK
jgi:hypothetical protein